MNEKAFSYPMIAEGLTASPKKMMRLKMMQT
jgi:hypothetical protein